MTVNSVTLNGKTYNDGDAGPYNLGNGGHRTNFIPMLADAVIDLGAKAAAAATANGVLAMTYVFDSATADLDPTNGKLRLSNATQNAATTIRVDLLDSLGVDWTSVLDTFDASSSTIKGQIRLSKVADGSKWLTFNLTGRTTPTGYRDFTVVNTGASSASPFTSGDLILLSFTRNGDAGTSGINGVNAGLSYVYFNSTTAADPTSGKLKFNNATLSAATKLYISETDSNGNGAAAELATWDDSTSSIKGTLKIYKSSDVTKFAVFQVTGTLTDNGTWDTFDLTYVNGAGTFADGDPINLVFSRNGDAAVSVGLHEVDVSTGNGFGSTNTKIRRFTTTVTATGTAITYADSAANGGSFTINETGEYSITYSDRSSLSVEWMGISRNSSQLTTGIPTITAADRLAMTSMTTAGSNNYGSISVTLRLTAGDVIRAHTEGSANGTGSDVRFSIRKIGGA